VHAAAPAIAIQTPPGQAAAIDASTRELHDLAFRHGECYDSYLATEPGRTLFWARDREGVVSYVRRGGNLLAGGGLLTAPERKEELLHAWRTARGPASPTNGCDDSRIIACGRV
jgi:lysylphosphatidylglycerol synthetase-like protein (DUF2156 family)